MAPQMYHYNTTMHPGTADEDQCPLIDCRLMPSRRTGTQSAYVEVAETMADKFRSITWPENLYARDWAFKANAESPVA